MTNPHEEKKKIATIAAFSAILLAMVAIVAVGFSGEDSHDPEQSALPGGSHNPEQKALAGGSHDPEQSAQPAPHSEISTSLNAVKSICQPTDYKETCEESLSKAAGNTSDPKELVKAGFQVTIEALKEAIYKSDTLKEVAKDRMASQALDICKKLMDEGIADIQNSLDQFGSSELSNMDEFIDNLKVWLSAAMSYQESCIDAFKNTRGDTGKKMKEILRTSTMLTSNGLAMVTSVSEIVKDLNMTAIFGAHARRLLEEHEFPSWVDEEKRRLLAAAPRTIKKDMTVAKDGSGDFDSIKQAIKSIPKNSKKTFVLYVKEGDYNEQITFPRELNHVLLLGDGPTKTKITGKLNFAGGVQALNTATVTTVGAYFMAKDIGFENMAGPTGHEALALRVQSDFSVFYNCHMNGYQETLYAHANRQFYRDCTISGTVDIIKGDARAVFQNCTIIVRKPLENQQCYVTSQGRNSTHEPTGFVLHNCKIMADKTHNPVHLENKVYLGRPWKQFARTIIMESTIDGSIDPTGWATFFGSFGTNTCYFAEYGNKGPGADTKMRVTWKGYKKITPEEAQCFTAAKFLGGDSWIVAAGVPYTTGLIKA